MGLRPRRGELSLHRLVLTVVSPVKDFFFPPLCFACNNRLTDTESRVCNSCWHSIERVHSDDHTVQVLRERFSAEGYIDEFYSCYYFHEAGVFQKIVHSLKYDSITAFGIELGVRVGEMLNEQADVHSIDALIPIPLHKLKQRERGYNQSEFLCEGISHVLKRPVALSLVKRSKNTVSQTHLTANERKQNVGDAFEIFSDKKDSVAGKTFLVVDDVITTGSTIQSVAEVLKGAGAAKVIVASSALAKLE